jgi:hypothetical protein
MTIRVMSLWKIHNTAARRTMVVVSFPILFIANVALSVLGFALFWWRNQNELFRSSAHYWNTDERITDDPMN